MLKYVLFYIFATLLLGCKVVSYTTETDNRLENILKEYDKVIEIQSDKYVYFQNINDKFIIVKPGDVFIVNHLYDVDLDKVLIKHGDFRIVKKQLDRNYITKTKIEITNVYNF